jgi:hypothetical protein
LNESRWVRIARLKIMAVRGAIARIAEIDSGWRDATVVARTVQTGAPAMPLTDWELMSGARETGAGGARSAH